MRAAVSSGLLGLLAFGCAPSNRAQSPYRAPGEADRDVRKSEELAQRGAALLDSKADDAEVLLREALSYDLYNGVAHNNLGYLLLRRGLLYEAANEFEWARKLMPGHPDPRFNLALTLERAGRPDEAIAMYGTALEVQPGHLPTVKALARLQIRSGRADDRTVEFLREIALRGESVEWREWARGRLARVGEG
jgi:tetratricopeptide (TPR) repeat protein